MPGREPESRSFTGAGVRLHYLDWGGDGPPLVLLHGGSAHARWWDFVAPPLAGRFHVLAVDLRGHGESEWALDGAYRVADYAADVTVLVDALGREHQKLPVLAGHSLGSFVALHVAVGRPEGLAALVMVDGRAAVGSSISRTMRLLQILPQARYATLEEAVETWRPIPKETSARQKVLAHVARESFREDGDGWATKFDRATLAAYGPFDLTAELATLPFPILWVRGEKSLVVSPSAGRRFAAASPRGMIVEIPGAHHHVPLDRPEELAAEILAFSDRARLAPQATGAKRRTRSR